MGDHSMHMMNKTVEAVTEVVKNMLTTTMDHSGHNMADHSGHNMADHSGHNMADHSGHDMSGHGGHGVGHDSMNMDMDMDMPMYFKFSESATILFEPWKTQSAGGMFASCLGIFLLAMLYEGLKYYREYLFRRQYSATRYSTVNIPQDDGKVVINEGTYTLKSAMLSGHHALQTCLHMVQVTVSYFLMLIFMTYNVWLCLAVVLGAGLGYFLFGWKKAMVVDITEHCH